MRILHVFGCKEISLSRVNQFTSDDGGLHVPPCRKILVTHEDGQKTEIAFGADDASKLEIKEEDATQNSG